MNPRASRALRWFLFAALAARPGAQQTPEFVRIPGAAWHDRARCCRVVDGITGMPIAGAELLLVPESDHPLPGEFWSARAVQTDRDGFAHLDGTEPGWVVVRAPGYGPATYSAAPDRVVALAPALDVPVRLLDWAGRPVPGSRVGFCGGCGHTPDLVNATAGADGIAWLRGIDPCNSIADVYPQHGPFELDYESLDWYPGEPPFELWAREAPPIAGMVLDDRGRPVAGAFVGARHKHRGPWAKTDAAGQFHLFGAPVDHDILVEIDRRTIQFEDLPRGRSQLLRLPPPGEDEHQTGEVEPIGPPPEPEPAPRRREVELHVSGLPDQGRVLWALPDRMQDITEAVRGRLPLGVDPQEPLVLALEADRAIRMFRFAPERLHDGRPLSLRWFAPTLVHGRITDAAGKPAVAQLRVTGWRSMQRRDEPPPPGAAAPDGTFELRTATTGLAFVQVTAAQGPRRVVPALLPPRGDDARLNLGTIELSPAPELRILAADGTPLAGARAVWLRPGMLDFRDDSPPVFPLDETSAWSGPDLRPGDAVLIPTGRDDDEDASPRRVHVALRHVVAELPQTLTVPAARLVLVLEDDAGRPLPSCTVILGTHAWQAQAALQIHAVPAGAHRVFLAAPGRRSRILEVTLRPGETRAERIALAPR